MDSHKPESQEQLIKAIKENSDQQATELIRAQQPSGRKISEIAKIVGGAKKSNDLYNQFESTRNAFNPPLTKEDPLSVENSFSHVFGGGSRGLKGLFGSGRRRGGKDASNTPLSSNAQGADAGGIIGGLTSRATGGATGGKAASLNDLYNTSGDGEADDAVDGVNGATLPKKPSKWERAKGAFGAYSTFRKTPFGQQFESTLRSTPFGQYAEGKALSLRDKAMNKAMEWGGMSIEEPTEEEIQADLNDMAMDDDFVL